MWELYLVEVKGEKQAMLVISDKDGPVGRLILDKEQTTEIIDGFKQLLARMNNLTGKPS